MKKVLFITYYWPPSGKASLHWPLKIIKYLPEFGWAPSVLTAKDDVFSKKDESLLKEIPADLKVNRTNSIEPFEIYKKFLGKDKDEVLVASETISKTNKGLAHRISIWIRFNLFVPDARVGWFFPAVKEGKKYLEKNPHDAIVSIGPPHTSHLIGMRLAKKYRVLHIPVFIDPWTDIVYYKDFKRNSAAKGLDNYFEKKVMTNAGKVVFVTETMKNDYVKKYPFLKNKSHVLYWGYNEEDFDGINFSIDDKEEVLVHAGNIFDYQNPKNLWRQLKSEIDNGRNLKLKFIGSVSPGIKMELEANGLISATEFAGFLPYKQMLQELANSNYLLVCATERRHLPGKLFEYLRSGRPIIAFGDDNEEVKRIIEETNSGMMFKYSESGKEFFNHAGKFQINIEEVKKYDRRKIAEAVSEILNH